MIPIFSRVLLIPVGGSAPSGRIGLCRRHPRLFSGSHHGLRGSHGDSVTASEGGPDLFARRAEGSTEASEDFFILFLSVLHGHCRRDLVPGVSLRDAKREVEVSLDVVKLDDPSSCFAMFELHIVSICIKEFVCGQ